MAIDEGVRDTYLTLLKEHRDKLRAEIDKLRVRIERTRLEDQVQGALTAGQQATLRAVGLLDSDDLATLTAKRQELTERRQALIALIQAVEVAV